MNKLLTSLFGTKETVKVHSMDADGNVTTSKQVRTTVFGHLVKVEYIK